ncbi:MAG: Rne/Rng family ribonuclease [Deltaproteobacteria bacterium]
MDKELLINSKNGSVEIALIEDSKLVEFHEEVTNSEFAVGDIYYGKIRQLMPGHNGAFVDIGYLKNAFLHYSDLGPQLESLLKYIRIAENDKNSAPSLDNFKLENDIDKNGKVVDVLKKDQNIIVQILKEPISTKGPRLTCEITIAGRYIVMTPFSNNVSISKKIQSDDEVKRLKILIESIKPKNFGIIARTAAEGKSVSVLHEEMKSLVDKWNKMFEELKNSKPPVKLLTEIDKASVLLRDILNDSFNKIIVSEDDIFLKTKNYLKQIAPDQIKILKMHRGKSTLFQAHGVTKQIKSSFGKTYTLKSGAYIIIEHTEAMHVIDVNSGPKLRKDSQEEAAIAVNLEAAEEIARQLRLRDLGGLIIIDFIDMRSYENKKVLYKEIKNFMQNDRAQHTVLPLSKFGLMQITRQRTKPEIKINTMEICPVCDGTGKVTPSILIIDDIERDLKYILNSGHKSNLSVIVHPFVHSYLSKGFPSKRMKWFFRLGTWIKLTKNENFSINEYKILDNSEDEIKLN